MKNFTLKQKMQLLTEFVKFIENEEENYPMLVKMIRERVDRSVVK